MRRSRCPICGSADVGELIQISDVPVFCNVFHRSSEEARNIPRGTIQLVQCGRCGHGWNEAFDPALLDYNTDYENSLHFSRTFSEYARNLAAELARRHHLQDKVVVEIGCGRGEFLELLCTAGKCRGVGFDPSLRAIPPAADSGRIRFVPDVLRPDYLTEKWDFVVCRHVLEHLADPRTLLDSVKTCVRDGTSPTGYFEVPNFSWMLGAGSVWDVIYEHPHYFTRGSLRYLFERCGFETIGLRERYGDQYLGIDIRYTPLGDGEAKPGSVAVDVPDPAKAPLPDGHALSRSLERWSAWLKGEVASASKLVIWGAGSKTVSFLNLLNSDAQGFWVVDVNPRKQGRYVPGTGHRIDPPEALRKIRPDVVLVANARYAGEVREALDLYAPEAVLLTLVD